MRPLIILAEPAQGRRASSTSKVHANTYTFTDIIVRGSQPGSTRINGLNNLGQAAGWYFDSAGSFGNFIDTHGALSDISNALSLTSLETNAINDRGQALDGNFPDFEVLNASGVVASINISGAKGDAYINGFNRTMLDKP